MPGARPRPRSMRPGKSASSTLNRSATISGAWLGSMTPPGAHAHALRRRRDLPDHDVGGGARNGRKVVMLGDPITCVAETVGEAGKIDGVAQRGGTGRTGGNRRKIKDRERDHAQHAIRKRRKRQSFFQPVKRPLRNWSAMAEATG